LQPKIPLQVALDPIFNDQHDYLPLFYHYVHLCTSRFDSTEIYYSAYRVVAQSSGYGKTKLLLQLGKFLPVIPMCIRKLKDQGEPERTPTVDLFSSLKSELEIVAFLAGTMRTAALLYDDPMIEIQRDNTKSHIVPDDIYHRLTKRPLFGISSEAFSDSVTAHYCQIRDELKVLVPCPTHSLTLFRAASLKYPL